MSFDGVVTNAMMRELKGALTAGKIEKIYQPQSEQLVFLVHTKGGKKRLFVSAAGNHSAVYLIDETPENPVDPPVFCMVLRKHLGAARITDIIQHENDRIIEIMFETVDELGFNVNRKLIIEIMGKHSNVLLVDMQTGKIIDSIKHVSLDVNRARQALPGKIYEYPPEQSKTPFETISEADWDSLIDGETQPERRILGGVQGISPALAETLAYGCAANGINEATGGETAGSYARLEALREALASGKTTPLVYVDSDGKPLDFHITELATYQGAEILHFETVSEAAAYFFRHRESSNTIKQKSNDLLRVVKSHTDKLNLKVQRLNEDLVKAENSEKYRLYGELLTANLHLAKTGDRSVTVTNYYDDSQMQIPLDPRFSPSKNAQNFYKKYGKSKTAIKEKQIQLEETGRELDYLDSVTSFIERAGSIEEIDLLRKELVEAGYIRYRKPPKNRALKKDKPKPYEYTLTSGRRVLVGRNNKENDWLTFKKASPQDIWLHTKDIPGSHVILLLDSGAVEADAADDRLVPPGAEPTEAELFEAAAIAAYHSKAQGSENVPVDYTKVRNVKKPNGSAPGYVIFVKNRTLYVNPTLPE